MFSLFTQSFAKDPELRRLPNLSPPSADLHHRLQVPRRQQTDDQEKDADPVALYLPNLSQPPADVAFRSRGGSRPKILSSISAGSRRLLSRSSALLEVGLQAAILTALTSCQDRLTQNWCWSVVSREQRAESRELG